MGLDCPGMRGGALCYSDGAISPFSPFKAPGSSLLIYPLREKCKFIGLVGFLVEQAPLRLSSLWDSLHSLTVNTIGRLADWAKT